MRKLTFFIALCLACVGSSQMWDKVVAPGLTYRMIVQPEAPRLIHALRMTLKSPHVRALPALGKKVVFTENVNESRATVSEMVRDEGAIGGINGDFFPWTGDPIGLMVRDNELWSIPYRSRASFGWGPTNALATSATFKGAIKTSGREPFALDGVNQEAGENETVLNFERAGYARAKGGGDHLVIKISFGGSPVSGKVEGVVQGTVRGANVKVEPGTALISTTGENRAQIRSIQPGETVIIELEVSGFSWDSISHAVAGGPFLLREGKPYIPWKEEGFGPDFAEKRHPRTAVGKTSDGDVWWVVVDGRQSMSIGATLEEMSMIMMDLGCVEAVNLDGGGSTTMNLFGVTLNRPSDGKERPVANGVVLMGPKPDRLSADLQMVVPSKVLVSTTVRLKVRIGKDFEVPNAEVLWSCQGSAWIDQGGTLHPFGRGKAEVTAFCNGVTLRKSITIE